MSEPQAVGQEPPPLQRPARPFRPGMISISLLPFASGLLVVGWWAQDAAQDGSRATLAYLVGMSACAVALIGTMMGAAALKPGSRSIALAILATTLHFLLLAAGAFLLLAIAGVAQIGD